MDNSLKTGSIIVLFVFALAVLLGIGASFFEGKNNEAYDKSGEKSISQPKPTTSEPDKGPASEVEVPSKITLPELEKVWGQIEETNLLVIVTSIIIMMMMIWMVFFKKPKITTESQEKDTTQSQASSSQNGKTLVILVLLGLAGYVIVQAYDISLKDVAESGVGNKVLSYMDELASIDLKAFPENFSEYSGIVMPLLLGLLILATFFDKKTGGITAIIIAIIFGFIYLATNSSLRSSTISVDLSDKIIGEPLTIRMEPRSRTRVTLPDLIKYRMNRDRFGGKVSRVCAQIVGPTHIFNIENFPNHHVTLTNSNPKKGRVHELVLTEDIKMVMTKNEIPWVEVDYFIVPKYPHEPSPCSHSD